MKLWYFLLLQDIFFFFGLPNKNKTHNSDGPPYRWTDNKQTNKRKHAACDECFHDLMWQMNNEQWLVSSLWVPRGVGSHTKAVLPAEQQEIAARIQFVQSEQLAYVIECVRWHVRWLVINRRDAVLSRLACCCLLRIWKKFSIPKPYFWWNSFHRQL